MKTIRNTAAYGDIESAFQLFAGAYDVTLDELIDLFGHEAWRHNTPGYGGNRWRTIAMALKKIRQAAADGDTDTIDELTASIPLMRHNNGILGDKLAQLNAKS